MPLMCSSQISTHQSLVALPPIDSSDILASFPKRSCKTARFALLRGVRVPPCIDLCFPLFQQARDGATDGRFDSSFIRCERFGSER